VKVDVIDDFAGAPIVVKVLGHVKGYSSSFLVKGESLAIRM